MENVYRGSPARVRDRHAFLSRMLPSAPPAFFAILVFVRDGLPALAGLYAEEGDAIETGNQPSAAGRLPCYP